MPWNFLCWKLDMIYWVIWTYTNRSSVWVYMLIWLELVLCLILLYFCISLDAKDFKSSFLSFSSFFLLVFNSFFLLFFLLSFLLLSLSPLSFTSFLSLFFPSFRPSFLQSFFPLSFSFLFFRFSPVVFWLP